jgi:hypothetical protein
MKIETFCAFALMAWLIVGWLWLFYAIVKALCR